MRLLYFAWVREKIGSDGEDVEPPDEVTTIADLVDWLAERGGGYAEAFADKAALRAARDQQFVPLDSAIEGAAEIALFPPVTGG